MESASGEDIKAFLSELAVKGRVAIATQKQALNALVYLFREALGREAGDFSGYQLSRRGPRVPTVLTRKECHRLFEVMQGTSHSSDESDRQDGSDIQSPKSKVPSPRSKVPLLGDCECEGCGT